MRLLAALLVAATVAAALRDTVVPESSSTLPNTRTPLHSLPGWEGGMPTDQYTGYVTVNQQQGRRLFYWFVESQRSPSTDPVVLWLTGGPGCSSLFALFTEHGPFYVYPDGTTLGLRNTSWNTQANVIYLESPAGVGFSYVEDGNYTSGDEQTAWDAYHFMEGFYGLFPEYASNNFFIAGESYGGHYVPQLAQVVLEQGMPLTGFSVGNPWQDFAKDTQGYIVFLHNHALIPDSLFNEAFGACDGDFVPPLSNDCSAALNASLVGMTRINAYNVLADCIGDASPPGTCLTRHAVTAFAAPRPMSQSFIPCINVTNVQNYMEQEIVRTALSVEKGSLPWLPCSSVLNYVGQAESVLDLYPMFLSKYPDLRIIMYSGDEDSCCPYTGTEVCVDSLNMTVSTSFHAWFVEEQVAGYATEYGQFTYATVKGAGHMVPMYKPEQALVLINSFLDDIPL